MGVEVVEVGFFIDNILWNIIFEEFVVDIVLIC